MLILQNISKQYGNQPVFQNVTLHIPKTGFFLLFGESGSGKTTFLNILAGNLSFEEGNATYENEYCEKKIPDSFTQHMEYMTQDAFFVDFLNVLDNLEMLGTDEKQAIDLLCRFGLKERAGAFPATLSGGERQRLMLARSLARGKNVLLLDEPTASLDPQNKEQVFSLLKELSRDHLIIMASHDPKAREYADSVLHFDKTSPTVEIEVINLVLENDAGQENIFQNEGNGIKRKKADHYLKQWMRFSGREKRSRLLFILFMTIALLLCMLADTPEHKNETTMRSLYRLNVLKLTIQGDHEIEEVLPNDETIKAKVIDYGSSVPTQRGSYGTGMIITPDYELSLNVLPDEESLCSVSDRILYGSYYTGANQIILAKEMAESLSPTKPETLIGKTIRKGLFGLGDLELEIVGIFDKLTDIERIYLNNCGAQLSYGSFRHPEDDRHTFFVSASTFDPLIENTEFYSESGGRQRVWCLYFDSYQSMSRFYQDEREVLNRDLDREGGRVMLELEGIPLEYQMSWPLISGALLPLCALMLLLTLLFFANMKRTELAYNNRFIAVFEYAGYPKKATIHSLVRLSFLEFLLELGGSIVLALFMTFIGNIINRKHIVVPMQLFSYNPWILGISFVLIVTFAFFYLLASLSSVRTQGWYELLRETRDLL